MIMKVIAIAKKRVYLIIGSSSGPSGNSAQECGQ